MYRWEQFNGYNAFSWSVTSCVIHWRKMAAPRWFLNQLMKQHIGTAIKYSGKINRKFSYGQKFGIGMAVFAMELKHQEKCKLEKVDPETLTPSYLLRQSTTDTVSSALRVLTVLTTAILDAESEYQQALDALITLTEYSLEVLGNEYTQDTLGQKIIAARAEVESRKKVTDELELLANTVKNIVESAAEAAFLVDAEYARISASESLLSAMQQIKMCKEKSRELELQNLRLAERVITVTSKHSEEKNKQN